MNVSKLDKLLIIILCILLTIIIFFTFIYVDKNKDKNKGQNKTWFRSGSCSSYMNQTTIDVLKKNLIFETDDVEEADIYFPCGYNNIDNEIKMMPHVDEVDNRITTDKKIVFIIDNADQITAKNYLWLNILNYHGYHKAKTLSPNTYVLTLDHKQEDMIRLNKEHVDGKMYILKKNVQRQTGLHLTGSLDEINANKDSFVLAQELLLDSYLVNKRKINLRVYVVVLAYKNTINVYVYDDGFMYYTKKEFDPKDNSMDNHITTGYVDRQVYVDNPLTHKDFARYLDLDEGVSYYGDSEKRHLSDLEKNIRAQNIKISDLVFSRIHKLIADVFISFKGKICRKRDGSDNPIPIYDDYSAQIFGADVAVNKDLIPQIIEVNKGPDLDAKDERDKMVKFKLVDSVMSMLGLTKSENKNSAKNKSNDLKLVIQYNN
jgi:hypothetical protein